MAARSSVENQATELNRILSVGAAGQARVQGHVDTGRQVDGNPVWVFQLEVTPQDGRPYPVEHREIVSSAAIASYPDGALLACRIDPEDPRQIAFGDKPFL